MFFQSIYAQYSQIGVSAVIVDLFVNKNALSNTYLGVETYATGESVFVPPVAHLMTDQFTERNGLPTFTASLQGITDIDPYFYLDL